MSADIPQHLSWYAPAVQDEKLAAFKMPVEVLRISGIPDLPATNMQYRCGPLYNRPDKPQEAVIDLWTKDGKHWRATWTEVKGE